MANPNIREGCESIFAIPEFLPLAYLPWWKVLLAADWLMTEHQPSSRMPMAAAVEPTPTQPPLARASLLTASELAWYVKLCLLDSSLQQFPAYWFELW